MTDIQTLIDALKRLSTDHHYLFNASRIFLDETDGQPVTSAALDQLEGEFDRVMATFKHHGLGRFKHRRGSHQHNLDSLRANFNWKLRMLREEVAKAAGERTAPTLLSLRPSTAAMILKASGLGVAACWLCKSFAALDAEYTSSVQFHSDVVTDSKTRSLALTTSELFSRRLLLGGESKAGQCGRETDFMQAFTWMRMPPITGVVHREGSWFAMTAAGVYAWGLNSSGQLGIGSRAPHVCRPIRVDLAGVLSVHPHDCVTFFRTTEGWQAAGDNSVGQLALGAASDDVVTTPAVIPDSRSITSIQCTGGQTFAALGDNILACGDNATQQLGTGLQDRTLASLTPVIAPNGVSLAGARVVSGTGCTFFTIPAPPPPTPVSDTEDVPPIDPTPRPTCYVCGSNASCQIAQAARFAVIPCLRPLPFAVSNVLTLAKTTVMVSDGHLLGVGLDDFNQLTKAKTHIVKVGTLLLLQLPAPITAIVQHHKILWVRAGGAWYGRGWNYHKAVGSGSRAVSVMKWEAVTDLHVARCLNSIAHSTNPPLPVASFDCPLAPTQRVMKEVGQMKETPYARLEMKLLAMTGSTVVG